MIYSLIAFGGWFFWLSVLAIFLVISYAAAEKPRWADDDRLFWAVGWSIIGGAALLAFADIPSPDLTFWQFALGVLAYFGVGFIYAVVRWHLLLKGFYAERAAWIKANVPEGGLINSDNLRKHMKKTFGVYSDEAEPSFFKARLWIWSAFYLFDIVGSFIRNPLDLIVKLYGSIFAKMAENARRG